jgi:hypothetical protein
VERALQLPRELRARPGLGGRTPRSKTPSEGDEKPRVAQHTLSSLLLQADEGDQDSAALSATTVSVRLCVSLQGSPEPPATVELRDASCPSGQLSSGRYLKTADETVKLTD